MHLFFSNTYFVLLTSVLFLNIFLIAIGVDGCAEWVEAMGADVSGADNTGCPPVAIRIWC